MLQILWKRSFNEIIPQRMNNCALSSTHHRNLTISILAKARPRPARPLPRLCQIPLALATKAQTRAESRKSNPKEALGTGHVEPSLGKELYANQKTTTYNLESSADDISSSISSNGISKKDHGLKMAENSPVEDIKLELKALKETFSLQQIPRDSLYLGAAGVLPYAATSLSTVCLAWNINHPNVNSAFSLSPETANKLLELITPIQIGYGALIISFLGAIHWGLEYAEYGGRHSYRRLIYGVISPIIAWPTLLMPVETALISQFLAFNFMYFVDARATVKGWFPPWYSIYRFILTFFVGASILLSLVGRGRIVSSERQKLRKSAESLKPGDDTHSKVPKSGERNYKSSAE
ncbi:hypothetical protein K3495_g12639 [Podosphaera aphanis]|nr:hypothetical protein K3495_g12639 [Podosphaera aphanis]